MMKQETVRAERLRRAVPRAQGVGALIFTLLYVLSPEKYVWLALVRGAADEAAGAILFLASPLAW